MGNWLRRSIRMRPMRINSWSDIPRKRRTVSMSHYITNAVRYAQQNAQFKQQQSFAIVLILLYKH